MFSLFDRKPRKIAIDHDDYHAKHVGTLEDGRQFFLTTPFEPAGDNSPGCEYVALFVFDSRGELVEAKIDSMGPRGEVDQAAEKLLIEERLSGLGRLTNSRITVKPFQLERFGCNFGLIPRAPEDREDEWSVELHPGNFMSFVRPWSSGEYDT